MDACECFNILMILFSFIGFFNDGLKSCLCFLLLFVIMLAPRLDDPSSMRHEGVALASRIKEGDQGKTRKRVLAWDEKLSSIVREPSMHMKEGKHAI